MMSKRIPFFGHVIFAVLLGLGSSRNAQAQAPANDDPCGAVVLALQGGLCLAPTASTNAGATTSIPNGYGNTGNPKDVWFKFTTAATGPASFGATITVTGNPAGFVQLFSSTAAGCGGPLTTVDFSPNPATNGSGAPNTAAPRLITGLLLPSSTYYVRVAGFVDTDFVGPFTICVTDGPGTPACGTPAFALAYPTGVPTVTFGTGVNNAPPYLLTLTSTNLPTRTFTSAAGGPVVLPGLTPGVTYTLQVGVNCPSGGQNSSALTFSVPIANDEPCGAIALPLNGTVCAPVTANNGPATASAAAASLQGTPCVGTLAGAARDVWFTVQTAASGTGSTSLNIATTGDAAVRIRLLQAAGCTGPFTIVGCATNRDIPPTASSTTLLTAGGLTPGTTYYVLVDQAGNFATGTAGAFTICAATAPPCPAPSAPSIQAAGTTTATVGFSPPLSTPAPTSYVITYTPQGGTATSLTTTATIPVTLTGLLASTLYTVCVASNCAAGGQSPPICTTFTTATPIGCAAPASLAVTGITNTTASLTFAPVAGATSYQVTVTPQGGTSQTLSPNPTASPVALTGLTPGTTYTVAVTTVCPAGISMAATTTFTTTSTGIILYCNTGLGGNCVGPIITGVAILGTTLSNLGTTCTTVSNNAYATYPATGTTTATLVAGRSYQYRITPDLNNNADLVAWIDFNRDGVFQASEGTQVGLNAAPNQAATAAFTVPITAGTGLTGMRVRCRLAGSGLGPADACTQVGSGETEDYMVTISPLSATHESALAAQVGLFPNPATRSATLTVPAALRAPGATVRLLNALGQVIRQQPLAADTALDLAGLPAGLYSLLLASPEGPLVKRLVVE